MAVIAVLFIPRAIPTASATELLSSAIRYEDRAGAAKAFRVETGGQACAAGQADRKRMSVNNSARCGLVLQHIQNSPWGHGNPLSVKTYAAWRKGLHRHHDRVTKRKVSWEISTNTEEDPVHSASLELSASDYHATKLTLDFEDNAEVSISEDTEPSPTAPMSSGLDVVTTKKIVEPPLQHIDNPADLVEVRAWSMLHQLNAASGWEATVLRNGSHIRVDAVVTNEERKQQLLKAFAPIQEIELDVHLLSEGYSSAEVVPNRARPAGNEPGLAEGWLEQQFPESDARTRFSNDALRLSQQIFGRAFFIARLQQRQVAMAHCSCAKEIANLLAIENAELSSLQGSLSRSLEPLIGDASHSPSRPLTLIEAESLDIAMEDLFSASTGRDESAFGEHIQKLRNLL
jgi:hypothetical protein